MKTNRLNFEQFLHLISRKQHLSYAFMIGRLFFAAETKRNFKVGSVQRAVRVLGAKPHEAEKFFKYLANARLMEARKLSRRSRGRVAEANEGRFEEQNRRFAELAVRDPERYVDTYARHSMSLYERSRERRSIKPPR